MKTGYAISVGINALLVVALVAQWRISRSDRIGRATTQQRHAASPAPAASQRVAPNSPVQLGTGWQNWIEPLRSARVPTNALAGLVRDDFDQRWQARQDELQKKYMRGEIDADGLAAAGLEHDAELERELQDALGPKAYREWDMARVLKGMNANRARLSDTERNAVYDLERGLREQVRQAEADRLHGAIDQSTLTSRQQSAQDEVAAKLRSLLGEERAEQLQGADDTFGVVKRSLRQMPVTDTQLVALADAQRRWDETRSALVTREVNSGDPGVDVTLRAKEQEWQQEFEQILGRQGFDRYVKAQDSRYTDLQRNGTRWGLGQNDIEGVYDTIRSFDETVREYNRDAQARNIDSEIAHDAVQSFEKTTNQSLADRWGPEVVRELKGNGIVPGAAP